MTRLFVIKANWRFNVADNKKRLFLRKLILQNPHYKTEELIQFWKQKHPSVYIEMQDVYSARSSCRHKYGVADLANLPTKDNNPDPIGLLKLLLKKKKNIDFKLAKSLLATDGIELTTSVWEEATGNVTQSKVENEEIKKGPRDRFQPKTAKTTKKEILVPVENGDVYRVIEDALDDLMYKAKQIQDGDLVSQLKEARRQAIVSASKLDFA